MKTLPKTLPVQAQKVFDVLHKAVRPLSAYQILDQLRKKGVRSPPTVYRALDQLVNQGLAHKVESLGAFMACCHRDCAEHDGQSVFALCSSCGNVQEIHDANIEGTVRGIAEKMTSGFLAEINRKILEVTGLCRECAEKNVKQQER